MRVLFHIFSLGEAQIPVALSAQSTRKAPKNPAKWVFLVLYNKKLRFIWASSNMVKLIRLGEIFFKIFEFSKIFTT
jgi:hypothetical protein